jgi:hypothetical protein
VSRIGFVRREQVEALRIDADRMTEFGNMAADDEVQMRGDTAHLLAIRSR